ncbi:MAG TPA: hypothetical protein VNC61_11680 [Acidimicrobiales bacterium]|nr:hypothetical protein [Acidimicrobiales bacterium]
MDSQELVSTACPKISAMGWAFYFVPETFARGEELGLDGISFYIMGRGGVLGDVESTVIASAFGFFNPTLVQSMWDAGRKIVAPRDAGHAYMECCADFGRSRFGALKGLDAFCEAADAVNDAADPFGLALYSGIVAEPLVDDLPGRAMQLVTVLREFRGSAHIVALRAKGLEPKVAHHIYRPNDGALFGWSGDEAPTISDEDRALWKEAEALTDSIVRPGYSVIDEAGRHSLVAGLEAMENALAASA